MWSSSREPIPLLFNLSSTPHALGIGLYGVWMLFLLAALVRIGRTFLKKDNTVAFSHAQPAWIAILFLYHGLTYLGFNLLLTGTHERYMYIGYPFLLLAALWFLSQRVVFTQRLTVFCLFSAFVYGCFVFSIIGPLPGVFFAFRRHEFLASLHLFLLVLLADAWLQIWRAPYKILNKVDNLTALP